MRSQIDSAMLRTVSTFPWTIAHFWVPLNFVRTGYLLTYSICTLTRGKIQQWFVTHTCYQFCKCNTIQLISSLYIHRCSLLASLKRLRKWQVSAQKIPIALDKCELAKSQECLAMSGWFWMYSIRKWTWNRALHYVDTIAAPRDARWDFVGRPGIQTQGLARLGRESRPKIGSQFRLSIYHYPI